MFPEARIEIGLRTDCGRVAGVRVRSTRMVQAARLFAGRHPGEVAALLPTVFSLCGTAQRLACAQAVESAAGIVPTPGHLRLRRTALLAETLSEHGLGIIRDWPALAGCAVDLKPAKALRLAMTTVRTEPPGAVAAARVVLDDVLGAPAEAVVADPDGFRAWMDGSSRPAARLLSSLGRDGLASFGAGAPFHPMPPGGPADLGPRLAADGDGTYAAQPDHDGVVLETGPLARHAGHPVVAALLAEHGPGLLPRLTARLVDAASALRELEFLVQDLPDDPPPPTFDGSGAGLGVVEAARGLLAHRVELEDGRVKSYRILAPTEWNFHPAGSLAKGLEGVAADASLETRARLMVHAVDPCVACTVVVE